MLKYFTSLGCLGLLALSCSSKTGGVEGGGGIGGAGSGSSSLQVALSADRWQ